MKNSIEDEAEDDFIPLKPITRKEVIISSTTLHNFLLQFEKAIPELLNAVKKVRDEIHLDLNFKKK